MDCTANFKIVPYDSEEYRESILLRNEILRKPLGLSFSPNELEKEKDYIHIAGFYDDRIVATCLLVPEGNKCKMQRVAVKSDLQGAKIGSKMLKFFEEIALNQGFEKIYCHARKTAVDFYLKNHYLKEGDYFYENTILHLKMYKNISSNHPNC